jgi:hypothetical protein
MGVQNSRFSLAIQEDRDLLGLSAESTWHTFCGDKDKDALCHATQSDGSRRRTNPKQPFAASELRLEVLAPELGAAGYRVVEGAWSSAGSVDAHTDL